MSTTTTMIFFLPTVAALVVLMFAPAILRHYHGLVLAAGGGWLFTVSSDLPRIVNDTASSLSFGWRIVTLAGTLAGVIAGLIAFAIGCCRLARDKDSHRFRSLVEPARAGRRPDEDRR